MTSIRPLCVAALLLAVGVLGHPPSAFAQFGPPPPPPHDPHPKATSESIAAGKELFSGTCANCHGIDGSGANGPNIREAATNLGPEGLYTIIHGGVPGTGMPPFGMLSTQKIWQVIDYLSSLGHEGRVVATGDPKKGKEVFDSSGCAKCHMVDGVGGNAAPDLSKIGALRTTVKLQQILTDPGGNLPTDTFLQERSNYPAYLVYRVTLKDGKTIEGMRVDEDSFTMQLRDANGNLYSIQKRQLQKIEAEPGKSFMPSYKNKLSAAQMNDLIAYLAGLGGAQ